MTAHRRDVLHEVSGRFEHERVRDELRQKDAGLRFDWRAEPPSPWAAVRTALELSVAEREEADRVFGREHDDDEKGEHE